MISSMNIPAAPTTTAPRSARPARDVSSLRALVVATAMAVAFIAPVAMAQSDDYAEVNRLMRAGQLTEALSKADQFLASKSRDPQMRFLKGVIQTESGKTNDAIATFSKLTEDFPELPEPYNNLAVLYAGQSQFDKARAALEMAIRTNPSYATAHENLGDVYAKLASQAYSKALQLDASNSGVAPKLSLIRNLFAVDTKGAKAPVTSAPVTAATKPPQTQAATTPTTPAANATAAATTSSTNEQVEAAVQAWAKAWSTKNMDSYLGAYASNFTPPGGQSRKEWEAERKARIVPRNRIEVQLSDINVSVDGERASARFRQAYSSDSLSVTSRKTLDLVKSGNRWLIVRESAS